MIRLEQLTLGSYALAIVASTTLLLFCVAVRRRYFSPISNIPGPWLASFSVLWEVYEVIVGHIEVSVIALHRKHGMNVHGRRFHC